MDPVNNSNTTNEIPQPLSDACLKEKYHFKRWDCPEAFLLSRCLERASQVMARIEQF